MGCLWLPSVYSKNGAINLFQVSMTSYSSLESFENTFRETKFPKVLKSAFC